MDCQSYDSVHLTGRFPLKDVGHPVLIQDYIKADISA